MKKSTLSDISLDQRKKDHIKLALQSKLFPDQADRRFYYEPFLKSHPTNHIIPPFEIGEKELKYPLWISSMTGGTPAAALINKRLAKVCKEFGLGMGLGSCRIILDQPKYFSDFDVRKTIGNDAPLYANLGIAQIEKISQTNRWDVVSKLIERLNADGLIIHVNPLQEWLQPEGDRILVSPIESIRNAVDHLRFPIIVKEVGQGIGPKSLKALMQMPLEAIEFGALGGTNFSILELKRNASDIKKNQHPLAHIGHTAVDMVEMVNTIGQSLGSKMKCKKFIISGGINNFLDGYFLINRIKYPSIYGQASAFLTPARKGYSELYQYVKTQVDGLAIAYNYLTIR